MRRIISGGHNGQKARWRQTKTYKERGRGEGVGQINALRKTNDERQEIKKEK